MAGRMIYTTGTITATNGSAAIVGSGTLWLAIAKAGDTLYVDGLQYPILSVADDTHLTLAMNFGGTGAAGKSYAIIYHPGDTVQIATETRAIFEDLISEGRFLPVTGTPSAGLGENGQYALNATTFELWLKSAGAWSSLGILSAKYAATSTTSNTISASGSKTFSVASNLSYTAGTRVRAADAAAPTTNWMEGVVTSYSGGSLVFTADVSAGSGTKTSWIINLAGTRGATGATGATGAAGANGSNGVGVPTGGATGAALVKASGTDYDTTWKGVGSSANNLVALDASARLPAVNGSLLTNLPSPVVRGSSQATTSGTVFDFTGIPSGVNRIDVIFYGVSLSGTDDILIQIGTSGGLETTGYDSNAFRMTTSPAIAGDTNSTGFLIRISVAANAFTGIATIICLNSANRWVCSHAGSTASSVANIGSGAKLLSAGLDRVRVTCTGSSTFDSGSVNILYC